MSETDDQTAEHATGEIEVKLGARLAEARERLKLSASDVARQLKLSVAQVEALENDQFDRLPGSVFVRGFIRNYARLVKLDPEEFLQAVGDRLPQQASRPETPPSQDIPFPSARPRQWPKYAGIAAVLVVALAVYEFFVSSDETVVTTHSTEATPAPLPMAIPKEKPPPAPMAIPAKLPETSMPPPAAATRKAAAKMAATPEPSVEAPKPVAAIPSPAPAIEAPKPVAAIPSPAPAIEAPKPVAPVPSLEPAGPPSAASLPAPEPETASQTLKPSERQVTLVFEDESWVEIRDRDGMLILFQLNAPGTRQVVSGRPPLSFVIGNAHGVRLTYDDRPVDLARHTKTDVARMTLE
jgi:cytoskeleton protein RodZ